MRLPDREKGSVPTLYDFDLHDFSDYEDVKVEIKGWIESGYDLEKLDGGIIAWLIDNGYDFRNPVFKIPDGDNYEEFLHENESYPYDEKAYIFWRQIILNASNECEDVGVLEGIVDETLLFLPRNEELMNRLNSMMKVGENNERYFVACEITDEVRKITLDLYDFLYRTKD